MRSIAALLGVVLAPLFAFAQTETLYQSSLGMNGGAPYRLKRTELEAMGGTWVGKRFITRQAFANTSDPSSATFVTPVIYTPVR